MEIITKSEEQEYLAYHNYSDIIDNYVTGLKMIDTFDFSPYKKSVLVCGAMVAFDKGTINFINTMYNQCEDLFLLSEVTAQFRRYTQEKINMPFICTPHLLAKEILVEGINVPLTIHVRLLVKRKRFVNEAVTNMKMRHPRIGYGYAENWGYYAYLYLNKLISKLKPRKVVMWNEFYAFHTILIGICRQKGIPIEYMEFGCIPGTICIEKKGQQGESLIARKDYHKQWIIKSEEVNNSKQVLAYLSSNGLNRNVQTDNLFTNKMLLYGKPNRKNIVYFGNNDYESGICPYTLKSKKFHSPVFKSSLEAMEYLSLLAIKNHWNLIYKPHPIMVNLGHNIDNVGNVDIVDDVNINSLIDYADLVVTIVSQVAYIGLIRNKPVLMLGYTQLKNKKCTYEAFARKDIEQEINNALINGLTLQQKELFRLHVAKILKYYLYDDLTTREIRFGKNIDDVVEHL